MHCTCYRAYLWVQRDNAREYEHSQQKHNSQQDVSNGPHRGIEAEDFVDLIQQPVRLLAELDHMGAYIFEGIYAYIRYHNRAFKRR